MRLAYPPLDGMPKPAQLEPRKKKTRVASLLATRVFYFVVAPSRLLVGLATLD